MKSAILGAVGLALLATAASAHECRYEWNGRQWVWVCPQRVPEFRLPGVEFGHERHHDHERYDHDQRDHDYYRR